jgi:hypothetical protein
MGVFDTENSLPPNNPSIESLIDTQFISTSTPDGFVPNSYENQLIENYNKAYSPEQIGLQGSALYPGMGESINVGNYSGSIVGSNSIYVPTGNILPIDPILARKKAIDDAARKRAMELTKPVASPNVPTFTDARFQEKLNNDVLGFHNNLVKQAQSRYGEMWSKMLQDKSTDLGFKYLQGMKNYENIVKNVNQITDLVATTEEGLKNKTMTLSTEGKQLFNEYKNLAGNFSDYETIMSSDFETLQKRMLGVQDVNNYLNDSKIMATLEAEVKGNYSYNDKGGYYVNKNNEKTTYKNIIKDLTKSLAKNTFDYEIENGFLTENDIEAALDARLKDSFKQTGSITQKTEFNYATGEAEEINAWDVSKNEYSVDKPKIVKGFTYNPDGTRKEGGEFGVKALADYNMNLTSPKEITVNERKGDGTIQSKKIKGVGIDGAEILNPDGSTKVIPGKSYVSLGTMRTIVDPKDPNKYMVVQEVRMEVPTTQKGDKKLKTSDMDTYSSQDGFIVLSRNGEGTGTKSKVEKEITDSQKKKNYDSGYSNLNRLGKEKLKQNTGNNVQDNSDPLGLGL